MNTISSVPFLGLLSSLLLSSPLFSSPFSPLSRSNLPDSQEKWTRQVFLIKRLEYSHRSFHTVSGNNYKFLGWVLGLVLGWVPPPYCWITILARCRCHFNARLSTPAIDCLMAHGGILFSFSVGLQLHKLKKIVERISDGVTLINIAESCSESNVFSEQFLLILSVRVF